MAKKAEEANEQRLRLKEFEKEEREEARKLKSELKQQTEKVKSEMNGAKPEYAAKQPKKNNIFQQVASDHAQEYRPRVQKMERVYHPLDDML